MDIGEIQGLVREGTYAVSIYAQQERLEDNLDIIEIEKQSSQARSWSNIPTTHGGELSDFGLC